MPGHGVDTTIGNERPQLQDGSLVAGSDQPPALRYDQRPADHTPIHTDALPATPTARPQHRRLGVDRGARRTADTGRRPARTIPRPNTSGGSATGCCGVPGRLPAATPATGQAAATISTEQHTFRLFPDDTGDGLGPSGRRHARSSAPGRKICWAGDEAGRSIDADGDHGSRGTLPTCPRNRRGARRRPTDAGDPRGTATHRLVAQRAVGRRPVRADAVSSGPAHAVAVDPAARRSC